MTTKLAMERLAVQVKAKRGKRGLREIAEEIGDVSASTLSRIEQGKMPDLDTFMRLCEWLQVSPRDFFDSNSVEGMDSTTATGAVLSPTLSTPEIIEVHLRADRELDPETATALANMVRVTYDAIRMGKLGRKKEE